jgi:hypothetical protein
MGGTCAGREIGGDAAGGESVGQTRRMVALNYRKIEPFLAAMRRLQLVNLAVSLISGER